MSVSAGCRLAAIALAIAACGGEKTDAERLVEANAALQGARDAVAAQRARVTEAERGVETARSDLESARTGLGEAEAHLAEIESGIDLRKTDTLLFRTIQAGLLEDDRLAGAAIRAEVQRGVVTLHGTVESAGQRDVAVQISRSFPGVVSVQSMIQVPAAVAQ